MGRDCGWQRGEASEPWRTAQPQGCGGQSSEIPAQRISADQHSPALEACLLTHQGGQGLGAEARGSFVSLGLAAWTQPEGASAPQLGGRESGKSSGAAEEMRDFCLSLCLLVREERGFRAPPKWAPETSVRRGYQRGPQRWAWNANAAAATTKKPVYKQGSLSTHRPSQSLCILLVPGSCYPGTTSMGKCTAPQAGAMSWRPLLPQARPASIPLPHPRLSEPEPPNQLLL